MENKLKEILSDIAGLPLNDIVPDGYMKKDFMIASVDFVKILVSVEDEFAITFEYEDLILEDDITYKVFESKVKSLVHDLQEGKS